MGNKWADVQLGGEHYRLASDVPQTVNEEADSLIHGDRNEAYGHPAEDFAATAGFWRTWIQHKYGVDVPLTAHDVPWMMSLLKHSREANHHGNDNLVDVCGYIGTDEMVYDYERAHAKRPPSPWEDGPEPVYKWAEPTVKLPLDDEYPIAPDPEPAEETIRRIRGGGE